MQTEDPIKKIIRLSRPILKKHNVVKAGLFGSYARGEQRKKSDIDILVQLKGKKSYFDLIELEDQLKDKLGLKVDLVTYKSVNHHLKKIILSEEVRIL